MRLSFSRRLEFSFYGGVGTSGEVSKRFHIALNGRPYMLDTKNQAFTQGIQSIPLIRQQADGSNEPGEATVNPEDLWTRAQSDYYMGGGQEYFDQKDSLRSRFFKSLGVNPWTRGQLSLLPDTDKVVNEPTLNQQVLRAGDYVYHAYGTTLRFTQLPATTWTTCAIQNGEAVQNVFSAASDGFRIYAALGTNGIHRTVRGSTTAEHFSDLSCTLIAYTRGRLMAANGQSIFNVTNSGGAPSALFTHPIEDFKWTAIGEGTTAIYAAGYTGDKSQIYRVTIKEDGTGLEVPGLAGELPDGEIVRSIQGYLGFVIVGTDKGFRLASSDAQGNLTIGALVRTQAPVRALEPQDRFMWFGYENYDADHTGLGRTDLSVFTADGVPAFASDLMAGDPGFPVQGAVTSIITDSEGRLWFTVAGDGLYRQSLQTVAEGWVDSGAIGFGIPDTKIALRTDLKHKPLPQGGSVQVQVSADDAPFVDAGGSAVAGSTGPAEIIRVPEVSGALFHVRLLLRGAGTVLERWGFRAYPSATRGRMIAVPILLHDQVKTLDGNIQRQDIKAEYDYIEGLVGARKLVSYQELGSTYSAFLLEINLQREFVNDDQTAWNNTLVCKLKVMGD